MLKAETPLLHPSSLSGPLPATCSSVCLPEMLLSPPLPQARPIIPAQADFPPSMCAVGLGVEWQRWVAVGAGQWVTSSGWSGR